MQLKTVFTRWTRLAALLLMGGAFAWTLKLAVIISTNGEIIDTGAAAFLMKVGLVLLLIGSTGIGNRLSQNRQLWLRIAAILISPFLLFAAFLPFAFIASPLFEKIPLWYAQEEAPIAIAVLVSFTVGYFLYRSYQPNKVYSINH
jgi:uncharacterized membrane protein